MGRVVVPVDREVVRLQLGARVVVADPASELVPDTTARTGLLHRRLTADCDLSATLAAREVRPGSGAALFETPDDAAACFPAADGAWLVAEPLGRGHVIALGDPSPLTNARLAVADHAPLVVGLLTPGGGGEIEIEGERFPLGWRGGEPEVVARQPWPVAFDSGGPHERRQGRVDQRALADLAAAVEQTTGQTPLERMLLTGGADYEFTGAFDGDRLIASACSGPTPAIERRITRWVAGVGVATVVYGVWLLWVVAR